MTTEQLQHDPRTKQQIKDVLMKVLYEPTELAFKKRLDQLLVKNAVMGGYSHASFMYKGIIYNCDTNALPRKMNRLVPELKSAMDDYLKELKQLNEKELPYVVSYINQLLNSSNDLCDYLRLLPESLHYPVQTLIANCPCKSKKLSDETVELIIKKNQPYISMMKERMFTNLLIS